MRKMSEAFRKSLAMYDAQMMRSGRSMARSGKGKTADAASRPARPDDERGENELGFIAVLRELIPWAAPSHR